MRNLLHVLCFISGLFIQGGAFPFGAPFKSCAIIFPKHKGAERQTTDAPYTITVSPTSYSPGQDLTVTMWSKDALAFRGFQIRSQRVNGDKEEIVGGFTNFPNDVKPQTWYPKGDNKNCLTHMNNEPKYNLTFTWKAPATSVGDIHFSATFIQSYAVFWYDVKSSVVKAMVPDASAEFLGEVKPNLSAVITADGCGETKGCLMSPRYCFYDCDFLVTYKVDGDFIDFEMKGKADHFMSLAFSDDVRMGNDSTLTCLTAPWLSTVQLGYNPPNPKTNDKHRITGITNAEAEKQRDHVTCRFRRPRSMNVTWISNDKTTPATTTEVTFDLLSDTWHLFIAYGDAYDGTDVGHKHGPLPLITHDKVDLQQKTLVYAYSLPREVQAHGAMMIIAWVLCAGVSIIFARSFKNLGDDKMYCGAKLWFQLHRILAVLAFLLTVGAFVIIFVYKKEFVKDGRTQIHAGLGIAVQTLVLLQVVMGTLRPGPDSKFRPAFNTVHSINGGLCWALAASTMINAFTNISILPGNLKFVNLIVISVAVGLQVLWDIGFAINKYKKDKEGSEDKCSSYNLQTISVNVSSKEVEKRAERRMSVAERGCLMLYMLSTVMLTVMGVTFIFMY
ncbi:unnamed protein product [Owenia fusiformis]|uniref:Uncharacterized protein n=1 Tax=Owenia fusiformis TaxID=6347 RepID=A0A8J1UD18_OWEFU|nr:unnamed protein product [Owenia fusiformis]